jgi:hypothetical protein
MFGINTKGIKQAYQDFEQAGSTLPPSADPWVRLIVAFIQAVAKAVGD